MMHTRGWTCLPSLVALVALALAGCAPVRGPDQTPAERSHALRAATPPRYQLVAREAPEGRPPSLIVELIRLDAAGTVERTAEEQGGTGTARSWSFRPGFLLLPLAPVQTAIGLTGAAGLAGGFASTYLVRWGAGTVGAGVCAVAGSATSWREPLRWAKAPWAWAWDSESHARLWGVRPDQGRSPLEQCVTFAFDYSRYALFPVLPDQKRPAEAQATADARPPRRSRVEEQKAPCAIRHLTATVRTSRADAQELGLTAPVGTPTGGPVTLPIGPAVEAFCHDDELALELVAVPASAPSQRVTTRCVTRVSRWRRPGGPRIRWLAPPNVATGRAVVNAVSRKELLARVFLRADTPDAPITLWQIKQDGKVRGGAFAAPGRVGLGRAVVASPEAKIEFREAGDRTTLEVVAEAGENRKASSTATFVFSPSR